MTIFSSTILMSPHPALSKYDILIEIFRHFSLVKRPYVVAARRSNAYWGPPQHPAKFDDDASEDDSDDDKIAGFTDHLKRKTLSNLAVTCKAFSDLALG